MNREVSRIAPYRRPLQDDPVPAGEVISFPASVQNKLEEAQRLLHQNRPSEALAALQNAGAELARVSPELFALVVASQMGVRSITVDEVERDVRTVRNDRYALGVRYRREVQTTTSDKTTRRTIRLS